ncbi:MAG: hypothetical protein Q3966_05095 [Neisseria sp.]|nr:hypothetical protein [Neisseria sp.]
MNRIIWEISALLQKQNHISRQLAKQPLSNIERPFCRLPRLIIGNFKNAVLMQVNVIANAIVFHWP